MNKQQNTQSKRNQEKLKLLEIENALLKQRLASILNIANLENGYYFKKSGAIEELKETIGIKEKKENVPMSETLLEKQHINDFSFAKGDNK